MAAAAAAAARGGRRRGWIPTRLCPAINAPRPAFPARSFASRSPSRRVAWRLVGVGAGSPERRALYAARAKAGGGVVYACARACCPSPLWFLCAIARDRSLADAAARCHRVACCRAPPGALAPPGRHCSVAHGRSCAPHAHSPCVRHRTDARAPAAPTTAYAPSCRPCRGALQNRRNTPDRLELMKYNKYLRRMTLHREIKKK